MTDLQDIVSEQEVDIQSPVVVDRRGASKKSLRPSTQTASMKSKQRREVQTKTRPDEAER